MSILLTVSLEDGKLSVQRKVLCIGQDELTKLGTVGVTMEQGWVFIPNGEFIFTDELSQIGKAISEYIEYIEAQH